MLDYLPDRVQAGLAYCNLKRVCEVRIRADKPVEIVTLERSLFLGENGAQTEKRNALYLTKGEVEELVFKAAEHSLYSVENQIRQGFLTGKSGERIGLCGDCVYQGGELVTVTNFYGVCIRIPHEVKGCALPIMEACLSEKLSSVLICSPPRLGKTTMLKDLTRLVSEKHPIDIMVCDERGELSCENLGDRVDVMRFCEKERAFTQSIRALSPDLIVTDELTEEEFPLVEKAVQSGVCVFASMHGKADARPPKGFDYVIALNGIGRIGEIRKVK